MTRVENRGKVTGGETSCYHLTHALGGLTLTSDNDCSAFGIYVM